MIEKFEDWVLGREYREYDEAVRTHLHLQQPPPPLSKKKDGPGFRLLQYGGFRKSCIEQIQREHPKVERSLDKATSRFGVHWLVVYLPPTPEMDTIDDPENPDSPGAASVRQAKELGKKGWDQYQSYCRPLTEKHLWDFLQETVEPAPSPSNTIVYVKPTSRVHTLSRWQQGHNIGHAVWGYAKKATGGRIYAEFNKALREIVYELQQAHYAPNEPKPTAREIVTMLGRVLPVGASFRRIFQAQTPEQGSRNLDRPQFRANTALNSHDEAMFDLIATFINQGGKIPVATTGPIMADRKTNSVVPQQIYPDRGGKLEPNQEIQRMFKPRDWVWQPLKADQQAWENAARRLEEVIGKAVQACVWENVGGPIFSTTGYITTGA